jgi:hypothetical protein
MKRFILLSWLALLFLPMVAQAQIGLRLKSDSQRYLRYEEITVSLLIRNYSGNTLVFNEKTDRIFFTVNELSGRTAPIFDKTANPAAGLILGPGEAKELRIVINTIHDMQREGIYTITAYLNHSRLPRTHVSEPINVEVHEGTVVLERNIGLPAEKSTDVIKSIRLVLMLFHDVEEKIYCLRAEDDENIYATFRLGPAIAGDTPMIDIDSSSLVHVLIQSRPRLYSYLLFGFVGRNMKLRQQRYYAAENGPPYLSRQDGFIRVKNGRPAIEGVDYDLKK